MLAQPAFAMKALHSNAFRRMDNLSEAVNFTIAPVSASVLQEGPFALLYSSGNIVSSVITIEPSAALIIDGGLTIDIPIDGEAARRQRGGRGRACDRRAGRREQGDVQPDLAERADGGCVGPAQLQRDSGERGELLDGIDRELLVCGDDLSLQHLR